MAVRPRIGLVGAGRWAEVHRRALTELGAELAGVAVAREESRARVEGDWGVPATTDLEAFLEWDTQAVIVASPNHLHAPHTLAALQAGKHVLVEKPMALRVEDCARMRAAAREAGTVLAVGLEMRTFTLFERVKRLLDEDAIGGPLHLALDLWRRPYGSGAGGWKADPEKIGSTILEEPIHYLDLTRWYLGDPEQLRAWANDRPGREGDWQNLDVRLTFPGGAQALVTRSVAAFGHHVTLQLVGERGSLRALWWGRMDLDEQPFVRLELHRAGDREAPPELVDVPERTGHAFDVPRQTRAFLRAIAGEGAPAADGEDGERSVALCLAVEASLREGSRALGG